MGPGSMGWQDLGVVLLRLLSCATIDTCSQLTKRTMTVTTTILQFSIAGEGYLGPLFVVAGALQLMLRPQELGFIYTTSC